QSVQRGPRRLRRSGRRQFGVPYRRDMAVRHRVLCPRDATRQGEAWAHRPMVSVGQSISKKNRLPQLGRVSTRSSEPIALTSLEQMASPNPEPEKRWWDRALPSAATPVGRTGWERAAYDAGSYPGPVSRAETY